MRNYTCGQQSGYRRWCRSLARNGMHSYRAQRYNSNSDDSNDSKKKRKKNSDEDEERREEEKRKRRKKRREEEEERGPEKGIPQERLVRATPVAFYRLVDLIRLLPWGVLLQRLSSRYPSTCKKYPKTEEENPSGVLVLVRRHVWRWTAKKGRRRKNPCGSALPLLWQVVLHAAPITCEPYIPIPAALMPLVLLGVAFFIAARLPIPVECTTE